MYQPHIVLLFFLSLLFNPASSNLLEMDSADCVKLKMRVWATWNAQRLFVKRSNVTPLSRYGGLKGRKKRMYKMVVTQQFCDFCIDTSSGDSSV